MSEDLVHEFTKFLSIKKLLPCWFDYAPYEWVTKKNWQGLFMAYSEMLDEHAREIANSINELSRYVSILEAWAIRFEQIEDEDKKFTLIVELIEPVAIISINLPYIIRSRFIYSVAHLSHQANRIAKENWIDDFPLDTEVWFDAANDYGSIWKKYGKLKLGLEKIASKSYAKKMHDFRNSYNHRYSPKIEFGVSNLVTRIVSNTGKVSYGFGETAPLTLSTIVEILKSQHSLAIDAFKNYQKLIGEQIDAIERWERNNTPELRQSLTFQ
jgi:hypothetical protein